MRANLASAGLADAEARGEATVIRADVDSWAASTASRYDLVLCDPPYGAFDLDALLEGLDAAIVVVESDHELGRRLGGK